MWEWIYEHLDDVYERMHSNYRQPGAGALREVDSESMDEFGKFSMLPGELNSWKKLTVPPSTWPTKRKLIWKRLIS